MSNKKAGGLSKPKYPCGICCAAFLKPCGLRNHIIKHISEYGSQYHLMDLGNNSHSEITTMPSTDTQAFETTGDNRKMPEDDLIEVMQDPEKKQANKKIKSKRTLEITDPQMCDFCDEICLSETALNEHLMTVHSSNKSIEQQIVSANATSNKEKGVCQYYRCNACRTRYTRLPGIKQHLYEEHGISKDADHLQHITTHHDVTPTVVMPPGTKNRQHMCEFCDKGYDTTVSLNKHIRDTHRPDPLVCFQCGKTFPNERSLKNMKNANTLRNANTAANSAVLSMQLQRI